MKHQPIPRPGGGPTLAPLWQATAPAGPLLPRLTAAIDTDVLVIGAGVAGATTALHLAEAGVATVLLEATQPGEGATGRSGGLIAPDFIRHSPETLGRVMPRAAAERLTRLTGGSAAQVFALIARHAIDCDAQQDGFYTPAHNESLAETQRRYAAQWHSRGFPVAFVEGSEVQRRFGVARYCGALHFAEGGSLNPLAYARGLARAAQEAGARVFADSPVTSLVRDAEGWLASTADGSVRAARIVLAANGGNAMLHPMLQRTTLPLEVIQFATAPLSAGDRATVLPEGGAFTDKVPYLFTARLDGQGHLISGYPVSFMVRGAAAQHREAARRLRRHFATLSDPAIDYLWEGQAWVNSSLLPELYDLGPDALAIQADNGRGLATNTAIGIDVARALVAGDRASLAVTPRPPSPIRFHAGATLLPKLLMSMARLSS